MLEVSVDNFSPEFLAAIGAVEAHGHRSVPSFSIRDTDHIDPTPWFLDEAPRFAYFGLGYERGSTPCGTCGLVNARGDSAAFLGINTAPDGAWRRGDTGPWETWIAFRDRAGAKAAHRLARWLLRGEPEAPLWIKADFLIVYGAEHAKRPCWRRLIAVTPSGMIEPMPVHQEDVLAFLMWGGAA